MEINYYITPAEYELAESMGICKRTLETRVRILGWDKKRATTTPLMTKKDISENLRKYPKEILELAESNGICYNTFYFRVNKLKWDVMRAATTPIRQSRARN